MAVNIGTEVYSTDYLRFSAYSIKDLITRKLTADSKFTDQVYEGSNLAILIDMVSYMYQCLMYNLNNAAAESMFSDTQIYENINRLVKFIGYNPHGATAGTALFSLIQNSDIDYHGQTIFKYSAIDTGLTDTQGKKVYFSTIDTNQINANKSQSLLFYNGLWKLYSTVFTSSGEKFQTLQLTNLNSNSSDGTYVQADMIDVYIKEPGDTKPRLWVRKDQGVFTDNYVDNGSYIFSNDAKIYNVRLNENKNYEISFGNGVNGKIPSAGSQIYIFYLDSNDPSVNLELGTITGKLKHNPNIFGLSQNLYKQIFSVAEGNDSITSAEQLNSIYSAQWNNTTISTPTQVEEGVEDIRRNAPQWFKTGNRLITIDDWEYFIKNCFKDNITDVKCQNNWEYISTFYRWLYNLGIQTKNNPKYYLDQNKLTRQFKYADAADSNNIYLWIKMKNDAEIYRDVINAQVQDIKVMTAQPVYCKPLQVNFAICAETEENVTKTYFQNINTKEFDPKCYSQLELTLDANSAYTANNIRSQVTTIIQDFFETANSKLGQTIDYSELTKLLLNIDSIKRIRTIYHNTETGEEVIRNGLCFATWTTDFIELGADLEVSNISKSLNVFQYPTLYAKNDLAKRITIIKKAVSNSNLIQY